MPQRTRDVVLLAAAALCLTGTNLLLRSLVPHVPGAVPAEMFSISTANASILVLAAGLVLLMALGMVFRPRRARPRYPQRRPRGWE